MTHVSFLTNKPRPGYFLLAGAIALLAACSAGSDAPAGSGGSGAGASGQGGGPGAGGGATTSTTSTTSGSGGSGGDFAGFGGAPPVGGGCSDSTKDSIYLLGYDKEFYRFKPASLELTQITTLSCPGEQNNTAFSMAVGRDGTAWVLFQDGVIHHVDTATGACTATGFASGQAGFDTFGMGFVANAAGSEAETLYVADYDDKGLGKIDTATLTLAPVGQYDQLQGWAAELTGTGDGRLFGYFATAPVNVAEIDKASAHIVSVTPMPEVPIGSSWAFAFWGGDFWLFTGSQIRRYQPATGATTLVNSDVGFDIVGAGVSTCAPVTAPE